MIKVSEWMDEWMNEYGEIQSWMNEYGDNQVEVSFL